VTRAVLLSDIHANLVALEAVLHDVPSDAALWVTGDTVGYGPEPADVLALLRERDAFIVAGNHDLAVAGVIGVNEFNREAADAALMHRTWLSPEDRDALGELPLIATRDSFTLVHGSLRDPVWEYVLDRSAAPACIERAETPHCCHGHTHLPQVYEWRQGRAGVSARQPRDGEVVDLAKGRVLLNPGSVGQPRDGDPRAAWVVVDTTARTATFGRTRYDIVETQRRMRRRALPPFLAERLAYGY
jgi:diadenosine tetraphosphatase ApaH/serine/threonine PP2A family protein phosphatase